MHGYDGVARDVVHTAQSTALLSATEKAIGLVMDGVPTRPAPIGQPRPWTEVLKTVDGTAIRMHVVHRLCALSHHLSDHGSQWSKQSIRSMPESTGAPPSCFRGLPGFQSTENCEIAQKLVDRTFASATDGIVDLVCSWCSHRALFSRPSPPACSSAREAHLKPGYLAPGQLLAAPSPVGVYFDVCRAGSDRWEHGRRSWDGGSSRSDLQCDRCAMAAGKRTTWYACVRTGG